MCMYKGARTYADFSVSDSLVASPQNREGAYIYRFTHDFVKTVTHHISMTQHKKCSYCDVKIRVDNAN